MTGEFDTPGDSENPLYVIFTSGTTGNPKGVVIPRRCVENYVMQGHKRAAWGVFFSCLCYGGVLVLSEPDRVLEDAKICTILPATPSLLVTFGDPNGYPRLKKIFLGGESPSLALIERWWSPQRRIFNCYGPTEATICTSMAELQPGNPIILGEAMAETELLILNEHLEESDEGEICISGPGLGSGYYKNETLTSERFIMRNGSRVYRTLDRARREPWGIAFCGREDSMVKNRGNLINIDLDVLPILTSYPGVCSAAAFMHDGRLLGAVTPESINVTEMRLQLSDSHDKFVVPDQIIALQELCRTSSGKIDLIKLRGYFKSISESIFSNTMSGTPSEILQVTVAETLGHFVGSVTTHCSFWELGGNSLLAIKLLSSLRQKGYELSFQDLFAPVSLAILSKRLEPVSAKKETQSVPSMDSMQNNSFITSAITATQIGMIRSSIKSPGTSYMLVTIELPWNSETGYNDKVRNAWKVALERHTIFKTTFDLIEGMQKISPEYHHDWETRWVADEKFSFALLGESEELIKSTVHDADSNVFQPRNIFRLILNKSNTNASLLWLVHHSVIDGWSMSNIIEQVQTLLEGKILRGMPAQFWQFSQNLSQIKLPMEKQMEFWKEALSKVADAVPLTLPKPKDEIYEQRFGITTAEVDLELTQAEYLCRTQGVTLAAVIHAAWALLLRSYTAQDQVIFGTVFSGRDFPFQGIDTVVGPTLNTCPFPISLVDCDIKFDFIASVQRLLLDISSHQWSSQEALQTIMPGSHSRVYQSTLFLEYSLPGLTDSTWKFSRADVPEFDLTVIIRQEGDHILLRGIHNQEIYAKKVMQRMMIHFRNIFLALLDPQCYTIRQVCERMLEPSEFISLITKSPTLLNPYIGPSNLKDSFELGVNQWPEAMAVESLTRSMTYRELDQLGNYIAQIIAARVSPGDAVGIISDRSFEWVISVIAVMKAGTIYVPLDTKLPHQRMHSMIRTAEVRLCIFPNECSHSKFQSIFQENILLHKILEEKRVNMCPQLETTVMGEDIAYITFTSGSTGIPKGVQIPHQAVVSYLAYEPARMGARPGRRHSQMFSPGFDVNQAEIFGTLCFGATLVLVDPADPFAHLSRVDATMITPSFLSVLDPSDFSNIDTILFAGEAVPQALADRWTNNRTVYNSYGPCECTIGCLFKLLNPYEEVTLGQSIPRVGVYLLDSRNQPVPIGVPGEICLSGIQIANGYIGADMESVSRTHFISDPFVPGNHMYRTGDCAIWTENMEPRFLGRYDNQVKIRGYRVELNEVENVIRTASPQVHRAAVLVSNQTLLAYVEPENVDISGLQVALRARLPDYSCPSIIFSLPVLPTMPNQKLNRKALQSHLDLSRKPSQIQLTSLQSLMAQVWREAIGLPETRDFDAESDFLALGGNSLSQIKAAQIASRRLNTKLPMGLFIWNTTLSGLCKKITSHLPDEHGLSYQRSFTSTWKTAKPPYRSVSHIEEEIFKLSTLSPTPQAFNVTCHLRLLGDIDLRLFEKAIARATSHDPLLRSLFKVIDGSISREQTNASCEVIMDKVSEISISSFVNRPFDLAVGPLSRIMITQNSSWVDMIISQHHIITDKVAMKLLLQDIRDEYLHSIESDSETRGTVPAQGIPDYTIWAQWQKDHQSSLFTRNEHAAYWRNNLLDLPSPLFRSPVEGSRSFVGHSQSVKLKKPQALVGSMALYVALVGDALTKFQGLQDVIVGIPHIDRAEPGTEDLLGCFLDRLPVRVNLLSKSLNDFEDLIKTVQFSIQNALIHSIPLKDIRKITGQHELFQVMVVYNRWEDSITKSIEFPDIKLESGHCRTTGAKFPLLVEFTEEEHHTLCDFEYMEDMVSAEAVALILETMRETSSLL
ncbi:hypothetical protein N7495_006242 [Penicillium taxi]|uniref:uncharacterized protein n=1 Tax=Penicillium taxi TaxID=168475 RepID=UPI0025459DE6|nr:uncharacterized protein N7495_006242 [Penicillium taxi]KAJ5894551.1 hypothetical protein N7495_006242 [Penicillium taxi]